MTSKTSKLLPGLALLLAVLLGVGAWAFLRSTPAAGDDLGVVSAAESPVPAADHGRQSERLEPAAAALAPRPGELAPQDGELATEETGERKAALTQAEAELADALWVAGRVVFPAGTPLGEQVEVVAHGRKFKSRAMHRARVAPDGSFRVAFAPKTKAARIELEGQHLFLREPLTLKLGERTPPADVVLEPQLGGRLRGRLVLPAAAVDLAPELVGKPVGSFGMSSDYSSQTNRTAKLDANLGFELCGLPADYGHHVEFTSGVVAPVRLEDLRVAAGETLDKDFECRLGVRLAGRVVDAAGALPAKASVEVVTAQDGEESWQRASETRKVEKDGTFLLRGLAPGKITLSATAEQRLPAGLELGLLAEGDQRAGLELVLQTGGCIAGRVVWPDESPAADARVTLRRTQDPGSDEEEFRTLFEGVTSVRTNASGEFEVTGLLAVPHEVLAQAKPANAPPKGAGKVPTWKATLNPVPPGARDLKLVLQSGFSITGTVVDDTGAPVKRFRISAERLVESTEHTFDPTGMTGSTFTSEDGSFEFGGLLDGAYTLTASGAGVEASEPIVANSGATVAFVLRRRGSASGLVLKPDGAPAARAIVSVKEEDDWGYGDEATRTNAKGEFKLKSMPSGPVELIARLDGFASSEPAAIQTTPGQWLEGVRLQLRVGGTLTGQVLASSPGEAIQGRVVEASLEEGDREEEGTTDATGRFVLLHLDPGEYTVTLQPTEDQVAAFAGKERGFDRDWSLRHDLAKEAKVSVTDGATAHVVFGAAPRQRVPVSGVVRRGGKPAAGVRMRCQGFSEGEPGEVQLALTDAAGRYEFALAAPMTCIVQAQPSGSDGTQLCRSVEVPAAGLSGVDFALSSGRIAGRAVALDGKTQNWAWTTLEPLTPELQGGAVRPMSSSSGVDFDFTDLPAGTYELTLRAEHAQVFGNRSGDSEDEPAGVARREITLREGEELTGLVIELTPAASLGVRVLLESGASAGEGWLVLQCAGSAAAEWASFEAGSAEFESLAAGVYELTGQDGANATAAPLQVELAAGQRAEVTVTLKRGGHLSFRIEDAAGLPVTASVQVHAASGRAVHEQAVEADGSNGPHAPGRYRVVATDAAGRTVEATAEVLAGETVEVLLRFP